MVLYFLFLVNISPATVAMKNFAAASESNMKKRERKRVYCKKRRIAISEK